MHSFILREQHGEAVIINWGKFGNYEMSIRPEGKLEGHAAGKPSNWRRMEFVRPFSAEETLMQSGELRMLAYMLLLCCYKRMVTNDQREKLMGLLFIMTTTLYFFFLLLNGLLFPLSSQFAP